MKPIITLLSCLFMYSFSNAISTTSYMPMLSLEKTGVFNDENANGIAEVGESISYFFTVTNTGNSTITNITITDPLVTVTGNPITLAAAASDGSTFTAVYFITQADLNAGQVTNQATVTGLDSSSNSISDTSDDPNDPTDVDPNADGEPDDPTVITFSPQGAIRLLKVADPAPDGAYDTVGEVITYTFTVENIGATTLTNVVITDPLLGLNTAPIVLQTAATSTFTGNYTITAADLNAGQVINTATVTASDPNFNTVSDTSDDPNDPTDVDSNNDGDPDDPTVVTLSPQGAIRLLKVADPAPDGAYDTVGEVITYTFTVENIGATTLTNVVITDPLLGLNTAPIVLQTAVISTFTGNYTITVADLNAGQVINTATVTASDPNSNTVSDTSDDPNDPTDVDSNNDGDPDDPTVVMLQNSSSTTVSGTVYDDQNGDGIQDPNEPGIPSVTVTITDVNNSSQTIVTDSNGDWSAIVPAGLTTVDVNESTIPDQNAILTTIGSDPETVTALLNTNVATLNDGYNFPTTSGTVSGTVFEDLNGNGLSDSSEPGLAGVNVDVVDSNGNVQTVITDANGNWLATVPSGFTIVDLDETTLPNPSFTLTTTGSDPETITAVAGMDTISLSDGFFDFTVDIDNDGVLNAVDIDDDNDGILDSIETLSDDDGDGIPNSQDQDSDNDGIPDNVEAQIGTIIFASTVDSDGNGLDDAYEITPGAGTGLTVANFDSSTSPDYLNLDSDGDTILDSIEAFDFNTDGNADILPSGTDIDSDGLDDAFDGNVNGFLIPAGSVVIAGFFDLADTDNDGQNDFRDLDDDDDGILTINEATDSDNDGFPDYLQLVPTATITGSIFEDLDLSGTFTSGDGVLPFSLPIVISGSFAPITGNADSSGNFSLQVPDGTISISIDETLLPNVYTNTVGSNPTNVTINAGSTTNFDFGYVNTSFTLNAFFDTNNNGLREANENLFPSTSFQISENGTVASNILYSTGSTTEPANPSINYDFNATLNSFLITYYTVATPAITSQTISSGTQITYDFAIQAINPTTQDTQVTAAPLQDPRPGFNHNLNINIQNNLHTLQSGTLDYQNDASLTIIDIQQGGSSVLSSATITATGFTIPYSLNGFESTSYDVILNVPVTSALGTIINNTCNLIQSPVDSDVNNNTYVLSQTVIGSYDPNDTFESRGPEIDINSFNAGDDFIYTIRFQNLGTADAIFIRVENTLDSKHDISTVQMIDASDSFELTQTGSQLSWFFDQIFLPPASTGGDLSNGYIVFKVKPLPPFAVNDVINQRAEIYFDYNPAVITNVFESKFVDTTASITDFDEEILAYPNPQKGDVLNFENLNETKYSIYSITGQKLLSGIIENDKINIGELQSGIYLIKIGTSTVKIIKE